MAVITSKSSMAFFTIALLVMAVAVSDARLLQELPKVSGDLDAGKVAKAKGTTAPVMHGCIDSDVADIHGCGTMGPPPHGKLKVGTVEVSGALDVPVKLPGQGQGESMENKPDENSTGEKPTENYGQPGY